MGVGGTFAVGSHSLGGFPLQTGLTSQCCHLHLGEYYALGLGCETCRASVCETTDPGYGVAGHEKAFDPGDEECEAFDPGDEECEAFDPGDEEYDPGDEECEAFDPGDEECDPGDEECEAFDLECMIADLELQEYRAYDGPDHCSCEHFDHDEYTALGFDFSYL